MGGAEITTYDSLDHVAGPGAQQLVPGGQNLGRVRCAGEVVRATTAGRSGRGGRASCAALRRYDRQSRRGRTGRFRPLSARATPRAAVRKLSRLSKAWCSRTSAAARRRCGKTDASGLTCGRWPVTLMPCLPTACACLPTAAGKFRPPATTRGSAKFICASSLPDTFWGARRDDAGARADAAHVAWLTHPELSVWSWSDQILAGEITGSKYYPRGVTSILWLEENEQTARFEPAA